MPCQLEQQQTSDGVQQQHLDRQTPINVSAEFWNTLVKEGRNLFDPNQIEY